MAFQNWQIFLGFCKIHLAFQMWLQKSGNFCQFSQILGNAILLLKSYVDSTKPSFFIKIVFLIKLLMKTHSHVSFRAQNTQHPSKSGPFFYDLSRWLLKSYADSVKNLFHIFLVFLMKKLMKIYSNMSFTCSPTEFSK